MPDLLPLVETRRLSKHYGHVRALDDVDFVLLPGETHALVGDNGAGKSTLVKIIAGAVEPSAGELYLDGRPVRFTAPEQALAVGISTVYQNLALVGCRTIADNLFLGREPTRWGFVRRREMRAEATRMLADLKQMNIRDTAAEVADLSGGQRQAVAIARGVRLGSRLIVLDEPTAALGLRESREVLDLIRRLSDGQRSILIISHNLAHVFDVAERITVLRGGRAVGTVRASEASPNDVVRMITGSDLVLGGTDGRRRA